MLFPATATMPHTTRKKLVKMTNAPVYYALAQAQFNPIPAMPTKYIDDIQDALRKKGYPLFEQHEMTHVQFLGAAQEPPKPEITQTKSWLISKANRSAGFILGTSSIVYHTTHYETHEEFLPELMLGLKTVHEVVNLDHVSRLGLRYLDAVLPNDGETVLQYLQDGLRGITVSGEIPKYAMNESVFETKTGPLITQGTLVARVYQATAQLGYPQDIFPHGLVPKPCFENTGIMSHAVIDTDHFVEGLMPIELEKIEAQLASLHQGIKDSFVASTTEHAKNVWS